MAEDQRPLSRIPSVDLGAYVAARGSDRRRIARAVDETCRTIGFLVVENHEVPTRIIDDAWRAAGAFFDLPPERKRVAMAADPGCPRGYFPVASEALARTRGDETLPDRKECFSSGPLCRPAGNAPGQHYDFFYGNNLWPPDPPGFRPAWVAYYRAMEQLGARIMALLADALELDRDFFAAYHRHHLSALRALNYPAHPATPRAGQPRAGAHSDYGSVTILRPDPAVGGLEICPPGGEWMAAPPVADAFIVNIGDLMARWTNDRWVSTLHRVTAPVVGGLVPRRQSIAYFMNPDHDAEIVTIPTCLDAAGRSRYAPVMAGRYLLEKFRSAL